MEHHFATLSEVRTPPPLASTALILIVDTIATMHGSSIIVEKDAFLRLNTRKDFVSDTILDCYGSCELTCNKTGAPPYACGFDPPTCHNDACCYNSCGSCGHGWQNISDCGSTPIDSTTAPPPFSLTNMISSSNSSFASWTCTQSPCTVTLSDYAGFDGWTIVLDGSGHNVFIHCCKWCIDLCGLTTD